MIKLAKREELIPLFSAICRLGVGNASAKLFLMTCGSPKLEPACIFNYFIKRLACV
jgi:hypothetical protein